MITAVALLKVALEQTQPRKRRTGISGLGILGTAGGAVLGGLAGGAIGGGAGLPLLAAGDAAAQQDQMQAAASAQLKQMGVTVPAPPPRDITPQTMTAAGASLPVIGAGAGLLGGGLLAYQALKRDPHDDDEQEA